jgi:probable selenium-dependent hydroxylase accessory protein YqeC
VTDEALLDALASRDGVVCALGAGGKKSTLYRLAAARGGARVAVTSTVHIPPFPARLVAERVIADADDLAAAVEEAARRSAVVAYACPTVKRGRHGGVPPQLVARLHQSLGFDLTLVKADGARARTIKAPADDEPRLPPRVDTALLVVGIHAVGAVLDERIAHRVDRMTAVTGARAGEVITVGHVARLLCAPEGLLKDVPAQTRVVPLLNMVDDPGWESVAREVAERALAGSDRFDRVVLAAMRQRDPVVAVVTRSGSGPA